MNEVSDRRSLSRGQRRELCDWLASRGPCSASATGYQSSIHLYRGPAGNFIIKGPRGKGLRRKLGQSAIRREARIYRRLRNVPGIPKCFGWVEGGYLVLEHIPGDTLKDLDDRMQRLENHAQFYSRLLATLRGMHEAGVAHGDLKRKRNILVGPGQQPFVIDFGIAVVEKDWQGFLFGIVKRVDYNAWIKHKYRRRAADISAEDAPLYKPHLQRTGWIIRKLWHAATLRRLRKRWAESKRA